MVDGDKTWAKGWGKRLISLLRSAGYSNVMDFLADNPRESFVAVARRLGPDVAAIQLRMLFLRAALESGSFREAAYDSLLRELVENVSNWGVGTGADFQSVLAFSAWITSLTVEAGVKSIEPVAKRVWEELQKHPPPIGWSPAKDSVAPIRQAFDSSWPESLVIPPSGRIEELPGY